MPADYHPVFGPEDVAEVYLLDGGNRLDACEMAGIDVLDAFINPMVLSYDYYYAPDHPDPAFGERIDPYEFVISANIHRRHLTRAQKQELIEKLLREKPERSDRQTAELAKVDHKTIGKIRADLQATGEIPQLAHNVGKDGKSRQRRRLPLTPLQPRSRNLPTAGAPIFYSRNPDPDITAAIELKTALPSLPKSTNGAKPPGREHNEAIAAIVGHLRHNPTMFLSDVAMLMADDRARLARVSIFNRRAALAKIAQSLGLRIADNAWNGE